jgi:hypothetical protein
MEKNQLAEAFALHRFGGFLAEWIEKIEKKKLYPMVSFILGSGGVWVGNRSKIGARKQ